MVNAPDLSLRGPNGAVAISGRHLQFVQSNDKTYKPIASVAAVTAQPLAALPPYGCGVPLAGCDRLAGWQCLQRKFIDATPSGLSLRGGRRPTWQSRSTRPDHRKAIGENATAFPRLPRRFAPRNDTSGSAAVHQRPPAVEWLCTRRSVTALQAVGFAARIRWRKVNKFVIARPQRGRGALSAKREEVPLGCNLGKAVTFSPGPSCYPTVYCEIATSLRSSQ